MASSVQDFEMVRYGDLLMRLRSPEESAAIREIEDCFFNKTEPTDRTKLLRAAIVLTAESALKEAEKVVRCLGEFSLFTGNAKENLKLFLGEVEASEDPSLKLALRNRLILATREESELEKRGPKTPEELSAFAETLIAKAKEQFPRIIPESDVRLYEITQRTSLPVEETSLAQEVLDLGKALWGALFRS